MMARSTNAPSKGRIQMSKTNPPPFFHIRLATHGRSIQMGQSRPKSTIQVTSAYPPSSEVQRASPLVRFVPGADMVDSVTRSLDLQLNDCFFVKGPDKMNQPASAD
jgi:hypothetical protein